MTRAAWRLAPAAFLLPSLLGACEDDPQACTAEFRVLTLYVEDAASSPVTDATLTTVLVRTGDTLTSTFLGQFATGHYPVADDGALPLLRSAPDSLAVTVERGPASFTLGYRVDNGGGCHIRKLAGPDTLTVP